MDPLESIKPNKDSTLAMMQAAQGRGWQIFEIQQNGMFLTKDQVFGKCREVNIDIHQTNYFSVVNSCTTSLEEMDIVLLRKDPPFDMEYIYTTYLLELLEKKGVPVLNKPSSVRDCNEKLYALEFSECCPEYLVSRDEKVLHDFYEEHQDVVFKPLDGMGGSSVFRVSPKDKNLGVIIETLTQHGKFQTMAQKYLPAIRDGDKRILIINGEPIPYALARIPSANENRGNLAAGGEGVGKKLTKRDHFICDLVGKSLVSKGLYFVGIDVIGDYLTEINVTCPTCIRELDQAFGLNIGDEYIHFIEKEILSSG